MTKITLNTVIFVILVYEDSINSFFLASMPNIKNENIAGFGKQKKYYFLTKQNKLGEFSPERNKKKHAETWIFPSWYK